MDGSTPGFSVHHQLPELAQTHVHRIGDAIQPSHPLSSPSPPACVWDTEIFKKRSSRCCPPETYTLWENRPKNIVLFVGCHLYQIHSTQHSGWTISWKCWLLTNACLSVQLFATPWILACQASLPMEFSRQEYWSGKPFPSLQDLPDSGIEPITPALQADSLPSVSWSLLKLMSIESVMPSNHPIIGHPLLLPSVFPSIRVFSSESVLPIRWSKDWSFSFSISPSNEYLRLISFRLDWLDLLAV